MRFFRHLILLFAALFVVSAFSFAVYFFFFRDKSVEGMSVLSVTEELDTSSARFAHAAGRLKEGSAGEFNALCEESGLTPEQVLAAVQERTGGSLAAGGAPEDAKTAATAETPAYTKLFPELTAEPPTQSGYAEKTIYFTFDDGPSVNTEPILDTLQEYGITATFFVVPAADGSDAERLRSIVRAGHAIGIHSATHQYAEIYTSVESYLADFSAASDLIYEATGRRPDIFRFPGGSINNYNGSIYRELIAEMTRRGYTYFDWHTDGDETARATPESVYQAVMDGLRGRDRAVVLLHDGNGQWQAAEVFERMVVNLQEQGYRFDKLTNQVQPITFSTTD